MTFNGYRFMKTGSIFLVLASCGILLAVPAAASGKAPKPADEAKLQAKLFQKKLSKDDQILHALDRLTFGPRPGDVERVKTDWAQEMAGSAASSRTHTGESGLGCPASGAGIAADDAARSAAALSFAADDPGHREWQAADAGRSVAARQHRAFHHPVQGETSPGCRAGRTSARSERRSGTGASAG